MKKTIIVFLLASLFISCKNRHSAVKIKTDESTPDRITVETKEGSEESVSNNHTENSPEYDDVIRIIEGSYNESGVESPDKITIKYVGDGEAEINANWQMFHEIKRADIYLDTPKNSVRFLEVPPSF